MKKFRVLLLLLLGLGFFFGGALAAAPAELLKWIPDGGAFYGEFRPAVLLESPLFKEICRKYPSVQRYMDMGRSKVGGYQGDLESAVLCMTGDLQGYSIYLCFTRPMDFGQFSSGLKERGLEDKYEKTEIAGFPAYVFKEEMRGQRSCIVLLSDRVILSCPENAVEDVIHAPRISGNAAKLLGSTADLECFFRLFPDRETPDSTVCSYDAKADLTANSSLKLAVNLALSDTESAKKLERDIQQGLMLGVGILFADDSELGLDAFKCIRVSGSGKKLHLKADFSKDMVFRLVEYGVRQAEARERKLQEKKKTRDQRRIQTEQMDRKQAEGNAGLKPELRSNGNKAE